MACIAQIISTARYLPERVVTNAELTTRFTALGKPTVVDRLAASTGITQRFYVPDDWVTSDERWLFRSPVPSVASPRGEAIKTRSRGAQAPEYAQAPPRSHFPNPTSSDKCGWWDRLNLVGAEKQNYKREVERRETDCQFSAPAGAAARSSRSALASRRSTAALARGCVTS